MKRRATDCQRIPPGDPPRWDMEAHHQAAQRRHAHHVTPKGMDVLEAVLWGLLATVAFLWGCSPL